MPLTNLFFLHIAVCHIEFISVSVFVCLFVVSHTRLPTKHHLRIYFDLSFSLFFPLRFLFIHSFVAQFIVFLLHMELWLVTFLGKGQVKFNLQRVVSNSEIGSGFFLKMLLFLCVTLSGLVRISKTRYRWKGLSLLTLLLNKS